jgi:DNA polymerase III epsilon subunit-like protein
LALYIGITPAILRGQPKPATAFAFFRDSIRLSPLAAHNTCFDLPFLHSTQQRSCARVWSRREAHRLTVY